MVIKDGVVHVQAGCGVVADSDPDSEYEETVNKAQALIQAIRVTVERLRQAGPPRWSTRVSDQPPGNATAP
jgi:hypothetical protein